MIKTVKLASYELRRFKGPLPIIALLFLLLVPTLFGALYLWSNWDPYGKLDQVPVAVVNQDVPVEVEGKTVDAGSRLVSELQGDSIFDWQFVDETQAQQGLADGTYYLIVTIPPDFSANLVSGATEDPTRAQITVQRDDANGYLMGLLEASVQSQLEAAINRAAVGAYFESVFANLDTIRTDIGTAATGATQLAAGADLAVTGVTDQATGISAAKDGSSQLVSGLADAKVQSSQLVTGTSDAKASSAALVTGLSTLESGSTDLQSSAQQVADGSAQLASSVVPVLNAVSTLLPAIGQSSANAAAATTDVNDLVTQSLSPQVSAANNALTVLKTTNTHPELNPSIDALSAALDAVSTTTTDLSTAAGQASQAAGSVNSAAESLSSAASSSDPSSASADITFLATGSAQVATGVNTLTTGISTASSEASTLDSQIVQLSTGATDLDTGIGGLQLTAQKLDDGLGTLQTGSTALVDGVTQLDTGANQLSEQLTAEVNRIPTLDQNQEQESEQVLSSPADVVVTVDNPATFYGRGLAPLFFGIAIWVFAITVFLVLRPISGRALAGRASSARIALAGWLPVFGLAAIGALLLLGIVWLGLRLDPVNIGGSIGVVVLAAACFTAIAHFLRTWLGRVGSALALVLLMVQLTAAGGLYPVETLPAPFRAIHAFIPMTYLVDALRIVFSGGPTDHLWRDVAVLAGFTVVAIALGMLVVHRRRTFRVRDLHPILA